MVSVLDSGLSGPGSSAGWPNFFIFYLFILPHFVVFLGKAELTTTYFIFLGSFDVNDEDLIPFPEP